MSFKFNGVGILLLSGLVSASVLSGCGNKKSDGSGSSAETPQAYDTPGLAVYADKAYNGVDIEAGSYFGNRSALLYYLGPNGQTGDGHQMCQEILQAGDLGPIPVGTSQVGGTGNRWRAAQQRRYARVKAKQGEVLGEVREWKTMDGQPLRQIFGGKYLICFKDRGSRNVDSFGIFFEANQQMQDCVNVNMGFQNYSAQFSATYHGSRFNNQFSFSASRR